MKLKAKRRKKIKIVKMSEDKKTLFSKKKIIITAALILLFLVFAGLFAGKIIGYFRSPSISDHDQLNGDGLPYLTGSPEYTVEFYESVSDDPFRYLSESENFSALITVKDSFNTTYTSVYSVTAYSGKFRIENNSVTVIYDGEVLYKKTPAYFIRENRDDYSLFTELGIPTLDYLGEHMRLTEDETVKLEDDGIYLTVSFFDEDGEMTRQSVISKENGIAVYSKTLFGGAVRREIAINNIKVLTKGDINTDLFNLPDETGES